MYQLTIRLFAFSVLAITLFGADAFGQQLPPLRIGYTDHEILISNLPEYRDIEQQLASEYESSQRVLQAMLEDFQGQVETYQKRQALLSASKQAERETELAEVQQELQQKAADAEQDFAKRQAELLSPVFERVDAAIKKVADEMNLDLVLRIQAGPMQPIILYANEERVGDITREVAIELGIDPTGGAGQSATGN